MSLDDVCTRMAYYIYASSTDGHFKHSHSWYRNMWHTCLSALSTHEYPRPNLPFDVERELDKLCDGVDEEFREEISRNSKKFDKVVGLGAVITYFAVDRVPNGQRNEKHKKEGGARFECLYPVAAEDLKNNPLLLTGITANTGAFFKLVTENTRIIDDNSCYPNCICYSTSPTTRANVLHFAAAYGNAEFIKSVLYPEQDRFPNQQIREHYNGMISRWLRALIAPSCSRMSPFDMAVFYDDLKCAEALLTRTTVNAARDRKSDMASPNSSLPFRPYTESQLSLAVYHGNTEIVQILMDTGLIKPHHYPQAFREAANAGDSHMLMRLWKMCGEDESYLLDHDQKPGKRMCSPLHLAAAAGHLRCVQFLCQSQPLRIQPDAVGDLPLIYALENGHMKPEPAIRRDTQLTGFRELPAKLLCRQYSTSVRKIQTNSTAFSLLALTFQEIVHYLMEAFPAEVPPTAIKSAINCKRNKLARDLFHRIMERKDIIAECKPLTFAVEVGNFHMAEHILRQYAGNNKGSDYFLQVSEEPWCSDVSDALRAVLCSGALNAEKKAKFVIAFQLAGFKVSMVNVVRMVNDKTLTATICNSLRHPANQPQSQSSP
ncbi:ankyrin repeat protein [Cooperia oncophora]